VRYYLHSVRPIRIAAGPAGTVEYRFAEKFAELVTAKASDVRVSIITDESAAAATSRFARGDADLGFVRTDQKFPGSARALALIEHFAFILVVPKGSKIGSLGDLRGKKVAFVTSESGAEALFRSILTASQVEPDRVTLQPLPGGTAIEVCSLIDQFQAAILFASLSALAETKRFDRMTKIEVKASKAVRRWSARWPARRVKRSRPGFSQAVRNSRMRISKPSSSRNSSPFAGACRTRSSPSSPASYWRTRTPWRSATRSPRVSNRRIPTRTPSSSPI
jgi:hypothetical protein